MGNKRQKSFDSENRSILSKLPVIGSLFKSQASSDSIQITKRVVKPTLDDHLAPGQPKRILALDGGGVRGILAIAVLEKIEDILRDRYGNDPDFRLCDYYDLIGGTSTGSIIACALAAKQMRASEVKDLYFSLAPKIFKRRLIDSIRRPRGIYAAFDSAALETELKSVLGDIKLGSEKIGTGIAIVAKRVDTGSTWVLFNNPNGQFFHEPKDGKFIGNKDFPLRKLVRASTAAPFFFSPEKILIAKGRDGQKDEVGLFMDGGITLHNNPSFQLLMLINVNGYRFHWPLGADNVFMTSIGTGGLIEKRPAEELDRKLQVSKTLDALTSMIAGSEDFIETAMQWLSEPPLPRIIDGEIGAMSGDLIAGDTLLTYQRYNAMLNRDWLKVELGLDFDENEIKLIRDMTNPTGMNMAYEIGKHLADKCVSPAHFEKNFDIETVRA